jgi:hypothetical protein
MKTKLLLALGAISTAGCAAESTGPSAPATSIEVKVVPLELTGITDATFSVTVQNGNDEVVWSCPDLTSSRFGNGLGDLSYVGPCDAQSNPHTVTLELVSRSDAGGVLPETDWRDPTPVALEVDCVENADVPVTFNLVVMRRANQGFFDIAVTFEDVFCSAKFDCLERDFLHNPATGERDTTLVFAFACAAGVGEETTMYLDDLVINCDDGTTYNIDPTVGPGNQGGQPPLLYQVGTYWGQEVFEGQNIDKCYWNVAIGVDLTIPVPQDANCVLTATGTATGGTFVDNTSPDGSWWPIIEWTIPLTDGTGALICGENPMDGVGSGVVTGYTDQIGETFDHMYDCGLEPGQFACAGDVTVLAGEQLLFAAAPGGFTVHVGGTASPVFPLPPGHTLTRCCVEECCATP